MIPDAPLPPAGGTRLAWGAAHARMRKGYAPPSLLRHYGAAALARRWRAET